MTFSIVSCRKGEKREKKRKVGLKLGRNDVNLLIALKR